MTDSLRQRIADAFDEYECLVHVMTSEDYRKAADLALNAIHEPPAALVAKVADRMNMDATKVAGVWMMFIEEGRK